MAILTKRFLLRDFNASDAPAFVAYHTDPRSSQLSAPDGAITQRAEDLLAMFHDWAAEEPRQNCQFAASRFCGVLESKLTLLPVRLRTRRWVKILFRVSLE